MCDEKLNSLVEGEFAPLHAHKDIQRE